MQIQVTKFLSDARNLSDAALLGQAPTLLGDSAQRRQVLVLLLAAARSVPDSLYMAHRLCRALRLELDPALPEASRGVLAFLRQLCLYLYVYFVFMNKNSLCV